MRRGLDQKASVITRLATISVVFAALSGCGVIPRVAQQTTAAAIAPVATTARIVSNDLRAISRNMAISSARAQSSARQVTRQVAQTRAAANVARQRAQQTAQHVARTNARNATLRREFEESGIEAAQPFDILPQAVLAQLTPDQAELQRAAQKEAFTAPVGETIYWEDEGRTGTAMASDEQPLGSFVCRTFVQTVVIDTTEERADALACRSPDGVWEPSLDRLDELR